MAPRIPDVTSLGERPTPRSTRPIVGYRPASSGLEEAGQLLTTVANAEQEKQDRLEGAYAESALLKGQVELLDALKRDQDYATYGKRYDEKMAEIKAQAAGMIRSNSQRRLFDAEAEKAITRGKTHVNDLALAKEKDFGRGGLAETLHQNREALLKAADEKTRSQLLLSTSDAISGTKDRGYISAEEAAKTRIEFLNDYGKSWVGMQPAEEQIKLLNGAQTPTKGGFDAAIEAVLKNEGGYTPDDMGAPAIYGINARWHPGAFAEAKRITDANGEEAGKAYARDFYKKAFWDANNIERLPSETQSIVLDGVINHRLAFANRLKEAAASGASPSELLAMRKAEYERLVSENPKQYAGSKRAWDDRLATFYGGLSPSAGKTGTPADFLHPDEKLKLLESAKRDYEAVVKKRAEDDEKRAALVRVDAGLPLDPKNDTDRKALNTHFGATVQQWQSEGADQADILNRSVDYAVTKSLVPDALQSMIRSGLRSGNSDLAVVASDTVRRIRNGNPQVLDDFADSDLRRAEHIGALTDAGFTPGEAVRRADEAEQTPKNVIDSRKAEYKELTKNDEPGDYLKGQLNSWFTDDPNAIPAPMAADFTQAAEMEYQRTGNMDAARKLALNTVSRVWGMSRVGGENRYMRYAPERYYGRPNLSLQQNADWMTKQLTDEVSQIAPEHLKPLVTPENILVVPATTGKQPAYYVNVLNADGAYETLFDSKNRPLTWRPDYSQTESALQEEVAREDSITKARGYRQKLMTRETLPADEPGNPMIP